MIHSTELVDTMFIKTYRCWLEKREHGYAIGCVFLLVHHGYSHHSKSIFAEFMVTVWCRIIINAFYHQIVGNIIHDSCKFHPNYYGTWDLIEPSSIQESVGYEHPSSRLMAQFFIKNDKLIISSVTGISYTMNLYCVKEIQESLYDRYILRSDYQTNGW